MAAAATIASTDATLDAWLRAQEKKDLLRFVAIGSVDDGKSTLIGRLLHDAHGVYEDQLLAVRKASARGATRGEGSTSEIDLSLFTDGLKAEREQGITIDVAYRYFATDRRKFIIADTPGHVQYTRNMATGASTADVAIILVDARLGVLEQTRRHARIAALLGIPHLVACVNKMDLVAFDRAVFDRIVADLRVVCDEVGVKSLRAIPVSALGGDNVVTKSPRTPWWDGPPLLEHLETVPLADDRVDKGFRLPVQLVLRPSLAYRGFAGQIASGAVRVGDEVVALPSGRRTKVAGIDVAGKPVDEAFAPMCVALRLADEIDVSRGDAIVHPDDAPVVAHELLADLVWMSERPLDRRRSYLLKHTTRTVRADVVDGPALALNDIARVRVRCKKPVLADAYAKNRATGAFILVDAITNDTVAAGMIAEARVGDESRTTPVTDEERRARLGQAGVVLHVAAKDATAAALAVERVLFDRGRLAAVVASDDAAAVCARAGLVAVVPRAGAAFSASLGGDDLGAADAAAVVDALERRGLFD